MRDVGFLEDVAGRPEGEALVEGDGIQLGVEAERSSAEGTGSVNDLLHEIASKAFTAFYGQHATDVPDSRLSILEQACIGYDASLSRKEEMSGKIVDIILIDILDMLFGDEDGKASLEYLVEFFVG